MFEKLDYLIQYFSNKNKFLDFHLNYMQLKKKIFSEKKTKKNDRLIAFYDLSSLPCSFDIVTFLLNANLQTEYLDLDKFDICFISCEEILNNDLKHLEYQNKKELLLNIGVENTKLFQKVGSIFIIDNRDQAIDFFQNMKRSYAEIFPKDYNPNLPYERIPHREFYSHLITNVADVAKNNPDINCLKPNYNRIQMLKKWFEKNVKDKVPITITLREWKEVDQARSSKIEEWQKVVDYYDNKNSNILFIILRDYYNLYDDDSIVGNNVVYCNEAVLSSSFRAALYEMSTLNLFVTNGVGSLAWYNKNVNYIEFKHILDKGSTSQDFIDKYLKLNSGENWHGATPFQKIIWEEENSKKIIDEVKNMMQVLSHNNLLHKYKKYSSKVTTKNNQIERIKDVALPLDKRVSQKAFLYSYYLRRMLSIFDKTILSIKSIDDVKIDFNTRILLYGAGSKAREIMLKNELNIIGIIDKYLEDNHFLNDIKVDNIKNIQKYNYDYIIITPLNREILIANELYTLYNINKQLLIRA